MTLNTWFLILKMELVHVLPIFVNFFGFNLFFNFLDASCTFIYFLVLATTIHLMLKSHSMLSQCQLMDVKKDERNVVFKTRMLANIKSQVAHNVKWVVY
jgi:hypothetical protein